MSLAGNATVFARRCFRWSRDDVRTPPCFVCEMHSASAPGSDWRWFASPSSYSRETRRRSARSTKGVDLPKVSTKTLSLLSIVVCYLVTSPIQQYVCVSRHGLKEKAGGLVYHIQSISRIRLRIYKCPENIRCVKENRLSRTIRWRGGG